MIATYQTGEGPLSLASVFLLGGGGALRVGFLRPLETGMEHRVASKKQKSEDAVGASSSPRSAVSRSLRWQEEGGIRSTLPE